MCRNILRRKKITKREEGNLTDVLRQDNYMNIIPSANTLEKAIDYIKKLYGTTEGVIPNVHYYLENKIVLVLN